MPTILLFHSVLGRRPVEFGLADEWRAAGHDVTLPDLFDGRVAESYDDGFAILQDLGVETVAARAVAAAEPLPADTVLAGVSMGAGMAAQVWATRPHTAGVLFLAGPAPWPATVGRTSVQVHAARPDPFDDEAVFEAWEADNPGVHLEVFRYDGVGHYFLDNSLADFDATADRLCRQRCREFLAGF